MLALAVVVFYVLVAAYIKVYLTCFVFFPSFFLPWLGLYIQKGCFNYDSTGAVAHSPREIEAPEAEPAHDNSPVADKAPLADEPRSL
jgi:hypothetical protein